MKSRDLESRRNARAIASPVSWEMWKRYGLPRYPRSLRRPALMDEVILHGKAAVVCGLILRRQHGLSQQWVKLAPDTPTAIRRVRGYEETPREDYHLVSELLLVKSRWPASFSPRRLPRRHRRLCPFSLRDAREPLARMRRICARLRAAAAIA